MDGNNLVPPRPNEWLLAPNGESLPCAYCNHVPVILNMTIHAGRTMTSRFCRCSRQWFEAGRPVSLAHVLGSLPKGLKLASEAPTKTATDTAIPHR